LSDSENIIKIQDDNEKENGFFFEIHRVSWDPNNSDHFIKIDGYFKYIGGNLYTHKNSKPILVKTKKPLTKEETIAFEKATKDLKKVFLWR